MNKQNVFDYLSANVYPGRGILIGRSADGDYAVTAYFIMGRSTNSRNRIFIEDGAGIRTEAYDPALLSDPSLIIYAPVRVYGKYTIVTNGDQTDTVFDGLADGLTFEQSLRDREYEPDAPNYTPRISGVIDVNGSNYNYALSILKSNADATGCDRYTYSYENPIAGEGRIIHTYIGDGDPLPSFEGEPIRVEIADDIDTLTSKLWDALNADNKVSLFVRYIKIADGTCESRIVNRHQ